MLLWVWILAFVQLQLECTGGTAFLSSQLPLEMVSAAPNAKDAMQSDDATLNDGSCCAATLQPDSKIVVTFSRAILAPGVAGDSSETRTGLPFPSTAAAWSDQQKVPFRMVSDQGTVLDLDWQLVYLASHVAQVGPVPGGRWPPGIEFFLRPSADFRSYDGLRLQLGTDQEQTLRYKTAPLQWSLLSIRSAWTSSFSLTNSAVDPQLTLAGSSSMALDPSALSCSAALAVCEDENAQAAPGGTHLYWHWTPNHEKASAGVLPELPTGPDASVEVGFSQPVLARALGMALELSFSPVSSSSSSSSSPPSKALSMTVTSCSTQKLLVDSEGEWTDCIRVADIDFQLVLQAYDSDPELYAQGGATLQLSVPAGTLLDSSLDASWLASWPGLRLQMRAALPWTFALRNLEPFFWPNAPVWALEVRHGWSLRSSPNASSLGDLWRRALRLTVLDNDMPEQVVALQQVWFSSPSTVLFRPDSSLLKPEAHVRLQVVPQPELQDGFGLPLLQGQDVTFWLDRALDFQAEPEASNTSWPAAAGGQARWDVLLRDAAPWRFAVTALDGLPQVEAALRLLLFQQVGDTEDELEPASALVQGAEWVPALTGSDLQMVHLQVPSPSRGLFLRQRCLGDPYVLPQPSAYAATGLLAISDLHLIVQLQPEVLLVQVLRLIKEEQGGLPNVVPAAHANLTIFYQSGYLQLSKHAPTVRQRQAMQLSSAADSNNNNTSAPSHLWRTDPWGRLQVPLLPSSAPGGRRRRRTGRVFPSEAGRPVFSSSRTARPRRGAGAARLPSHGARVGSGRTSFCGLASTTNDSSGRGGAVALLVH